MQLSLEATVKMPDEIRIKKLILRSWRRGTREMDLILGGFADREIRGLSDEMLDSYEKLLDEIDNDIFDWICGNSECPEEYSTLLRLIANSLNHTWKRID